MTTVEHSVILLFSINKDNYTKYYKYIDIKYVKDNMKEIYKLLSCIDNYYSTTDRTEITIPELEAHYHACYPVIKDADKDNLKQMLSVVQSAPISDSIISYLRAHRNRGVASELAQTSFDFAEGRGSLDKISEVFSKFEDTLPDETTNEEIVTDDLEELLAKTVEGVGLNWRLAFLNQSIGPLRRGNFGFLFARPETGKTTLLASEVTCMLEQLEEGQTVLWVNNEEDGSKVKLRCYQALFGKTLPELVSRRVEAKQRWLERVGDRLKLYDSAAASRRSIDALCEQYKPSLIVIDQIDKIHGFLADRHDLQLKAIYQWARELSKKYGPVIGVCQASGNAEGKKYLGMNDVDSSHTAKQGEADFILGIGKTYEDGLSEVRYLSVSKNKLGSGESCIEDMRHGKSEVLIKPTIARYVDR